MSVANSKISLYNWIVVGLFALTFIVAAKMVFTRFPIPGISDVVNAA